MPRRAVAPRSRGGRLCRRAFGRVRAAGESGATLPYAATPMHWRKGEVRRSWSCGQWEKMEDGECTSNRGCPANGHLDSRDSVPRQQPRHQLLHSGYEAVAVEGIACEAI